MSEPNPFGEFDVNLVASMDESVMHESVSAPERDAPFRIAILGDFSGHASHKPESDPTRVRRPVEIDRDNFDEVLRKLGVELHLRLSGDERPPVVIRFNELEDFHPDRIYDQLDLFQSLRQTREKLRNPSTFASAAAEVRSWANEQTATREQPVAAEQPPTPDSSNLSGRDLLEQMLNDGGGARSTVRQSPEETELTRFLGEIVRPHLVADTEAQEAELGSVVDRAASELMRTILHHADFQALEAAWRGLYFIISRVEADTKLKIYLLDMTRDELAADLRSDETQRSDTYKLLVEQTVGTLGGEPWAVLAGDFTFDATREDAELLSRIAKIARQAGAPFLAGVSSRVVGCESLSETPDADDWQTSNTLSTDAREAWAALRRQPEAVFLGLAMPRFLLRLPYGEQTETTEQFDFEEILEGEPPHESYLWGNPSFACAYLLAEAFSRSGWEMRAGDVLEIEGLSLHVYEAMGESQVKPCAEVVLTERAAEKILDEGVMPLLSFRGGDNVRLARFQSLSDPLKPLSGRWV